MKPATSKKRRVIKLIIGSALLLFIGFCFGTYISTSAEYGGSNADAKVSTVVLDTKRAAVQNPDLLSIAKEIGANEISNVDIVYREKMQTPWAKGEYDPAYDGDIMNDGTRPNKRLATIGVLKETSSDAQYLKTTVAHEYMHHVWYGLLDVASRDKLASDLVSMYSTDQYMQNRTKKYVDEKMLSSTELLSFYCTEESDPYLTPGILSTCNKYINRSVLTMYR